MMQCSESDPPQLFKKLANSLLTQINKICEKFKTSPVIENILSPYQGYFRVVKLVHGVISLGFLGSFVVSKSGPRLSLLLPKVPGKLWDLTSMIYTFVDYLLYLADRVMAMDTLYLGQL